MPEGPQPTDLFTKALPIAAGMSGLHPLFPVRYSAHVRGKRANNGPEQMQ